MADIRIDEPRAGHFMREVANEAAQQQQAHATGVPHFPASAAGRGFTEYGRRLQRAFDIVHRRGDARITAIASTAEAAAQQFAALAETDGQFSQQLSHTGE
ncbi:hypothetical protein CPHO_10210 [Corynebacterium phocae]|uniref:ESX-1 secretion-associated protein n=1 Tax=Corynebacterium phocae TaxID=161895 RepID=A0A1L7D503_9CORY|nr:hypothetical protein [Corynebacterium phocae]APT93200.1 hypothetical protein CPHO_10210 [Corynebacterium phocae]KAA8721938.1 hypothetical protein F4V58_09685 [Corynebacterium phocae]